MPVAALSLELSSLAFLLAAIQNNNSQSQGSSPNSGEYLLIGMVAAILALVVLVFVRSITRRSQKK